jgi:hypothetical protein
MASRINLRYAGKYRLLRWGKKPSKAKGGRKKESVSADEGLSSCLYLVGAFLIVGMVLAVASVALLIAVIAVAVVIVAAVVTVVLSTTQRAVSLAKKAVSPPKRGRRRKKPLS